MGDAAVGWVAAQLAGFVTFGLVMAVTGEEDPEKLELGWTALANTGLWLTFLLVPVFVSNLKGRGVVTDFGYRGEAKDLRWIPAGLGLQFAVGIAMYLFYVPIMQVTNLDWEDVTEPVRELTDKATDPLNAVILLVMVGLVAPLTEELFYRGLVLRSVEKRFGTGWGVAVSSVVFGLSHMNLAIPGLVLFGVVVGLVTVRSGRLGPAIAIHVGFNMTSAVLSL